MLSSATHIRHTRRGDIAEKVQVEVSDRTPRQLVDWADLRQLREVAIIRDGHLGDLVMLTPTLRALRFFCPKTNFDLFCDQQYLEVFYGNPVLARPLQEFQRGSYDAVVDLRAFVERTPDVWTIDRISLFGRAFGISIWDGAPTIRRATNFAAASADLLDGLGVEVGAPFVIIGPDASDGHRAMPDKLVEGVCDECRAAGMTPVVVGMTRGLQVSVGVLVSLVMEARAVVCGDNALYHIAGAFPHMTKSFPILTTVPPELRTCWYKNCFPAVPAMPCAPCKEARTLPDGSPCLAVCMEAIDPAAIVACIGGGPI